MISLFVSACTTLPTAEAKKKSYTGHASWYSQGKRTANGEAFNPNAHTTAHRKYKFCTVLRLTNPKNDKTVMVRVNDRGPFIKGRELDVSRRVAEVLDFKHSGTANLRIQELDINVDNEAKNLYSSCIKKGV